MLKNSCSLIVHGAALTAYMHSDSLPESKALDGDFWPTVLKPNSKIRNCFILFFFLTLAGLINACATTPPVQEMSNARQTISAAHEANASKYAPKQMAEAEHLMSQATDALESGDYVTARDLAIAAQQMAIKARQIAVSKQNN